MKKSERAAQARRELDRKLAATSLESISARPRGGWIRAIRTALGMSQEVLAERLHISGPSMTQLEKSEVNETISVGKLADVARALDCRLVYVLVPNVSLDETVQRAAEQVASKTLAYVETTMGLEDQSVGSERRAEQLALEARNVIEANRQWSR